MDDPHGGVSRLTRTARVVQLIDDEPGGPGEPGGMIGRLHRLCAALARDLPAMGAGVSLLTEDHSGGGTAAASGAGARKLEELQFSLAEGPCIDAFASRRPVLEPELAGSGMRRWPGYGPAAHEQGVRAVFAFPLQVGGARLGALDVYRDTPGALSTQAISQAITFAEIAVSLLLDGQHGTQDGEAAAGLDDALAYRMEIYQAQGMVMVDLDVTLAEALARLRAHAFAAGQDLLAVARAIIAGNLRLDRDPPWPGDRADRADRADGADFDSDEG